MACMAFIITSHACTGVEVSFFMEVTKISGKLPNQYRNYTTINYIDIKIIDFNMDSRYYSLTTLFAGAVLAAWRACIITKRTQVKKENFMKIAATIARYLLALIFIVFGLNGFLHFIPQPPPPSELAQQYFTVMFTSHFPGVFFLGSKLAAVSFPFSRFGSLGVGPRRGCARQHSPFPRPWACWGRPAFSRGRGSRFLFSLLLPPPLLFFFYFIHHRTPPAALSPNNQSFSFKTFPRSRYFPPSPTDRSKT